jgi:hypothetical protein
VHGVEDKPGNEDDGEDDRSQHEGTFLAPTARRQFFSATSADDPDPHSAEVSKGRQAAEYLIEHAAQYGLDRQLAARLSSLQADLIAEAEEREAITGLPQRAAVGLSGHAPAISRLARTTADSPDAS